MRSRHPEAGMGTAASLEARGLKPLRSRVSLMISDSQGKLRSEHMK